MHSYILNLSFFLESYKGISVSHSHYREIKCYSHRQLLGKITSYHGVIYFLEKRCCSGGKGKRWKPWRREGEGEGGGSG